MKFSIKSFTIEKAYAETLRTKIGVFREATKTSKALWLTFITTHGLTQNAHAQSLVNQSITMDGLFLKKNELRVPGVFIYQLVDSMRDRVDRGLRLAERHVREALSGEAKEKAAAADPSKKIRPDAYSIGLLRESYRRIMREGMLDSKADVDLLLLAYELEATLISADLGVVEWAENLGLAHLSHEQLPAFLSSQAEQ
jgi:RNA ligase partner protein